MKPPGTTVFSSTTRVAVISAHWHADIVGRARQSLLAELGRLGLPAANVDCFDVPGPGSRERLCGLVDRLTVHVRR